MCTLDEINSLRRRFCAKLQLSEVVFCLIALEDSNSFIISFVIPSVLAPDLIEAASEIEESFFIEEYIIPLSVGNKWLRNPLLIPFSLKLREKYQQSDDSSSSVEWILSPSTKTFQLAIIKGKTVQQGHTEDRFVQVTTRGKVDTVLHAKSPMELKNIFRNTLHGGEIILIEGAQGSGKSTLTDHICQKWGKGQLFQQFTVVILVQLRDPAVQRVKSIADLLPGEIAAVAQELVTEIIATNGRGVLWILDGWGELPPHLQQDSIFCKLISKKLNETSVFVTSHPVSSGDLHPVVSSRIEVLGFTQQEQRQYFTECLKGDTKALEALLEMIQENHVVQSFCYLPLNAVFIVHTFKYRGQSLPDTEYEVYLSVILSCVQRNFEGEGGDHDLPRELASLDDLCWNKAVREPFRGLCELAYHGVMKNKVTFSFSDLPEESNTLGLLQTVKSLLQSENSVFFSFLHLSIQEVLSAYYIATQLSDSEQVSQFQQLFNQPRFAAVFQYYAAITKLKNPGICQVVSAIVKSKSKHLLVTFLRSLYEAQNPSLCFYTAEGLENMLDFSQTTLSPLDCLSISSFLSSINDNEISVNLIRCCIGNFGAKCLAKYLCNNTTKMILDLKYNDINEKGALYITRMLYFVEYLCLSHNPIGDTGASLISEAVIETTTLKTLILNDCGITSKGVECFTKALAQNDSLNTLDISGNNLGEEEIAQFLASYGFTLLTGKVYKDAKTHSLPQIDLIRKRIFAMARLADVNFTLVALDNTNCSTFSWCVPLIPVPDTIIIAKEMEEVLLDFGSVISVHVGKLWIYSPKLNLFSSTLKEQYQQSRGSPSPVEWIPSPTKKIFRLAMIQREKVQQGHIKDGFIRMTISGRIDDILHVKTPVELENIFRNTFALHTSEIILIEGAPGSGKSTLTLHICQRWGNGELFQQFTVVILVQLRDPAVQTAQTIADLLPIKKAQQLATELISTNGRSVLWVLDGWDELPPHLQRDSIFSKLLPPKSLSHYANLQNPNKRLLHEGTVIVTSRPVSSGDLHSVVSSRIEVLGFTPEE